MLITFFIFLLLLYEEGINWQPINIVVQLLSMISWGGLYIFECFVVLTVCLIDVFFVWLVELVRNR